MEAGEEVKKQQGPDNAKIDFDQYPIIYVETSDGSKREIQSKYAIKSSLIYSTWEDLAEKDEAISLPTVSDKALDWCIEFLKMDEEDPLGEIERPVKTNDLCDIIPDQYGEFIKKIFENIDDFYEILSVSNYLGIKDLLELTCA